MSNQVEEVQVQVSLPKESAALAQGLQKVFMDIVNAKKAGATGVALATAAVTASIADLEPAIAGIAALGDEVSAAPVGVAEAFSMAGFGVARQLTGK